MAITYTQIYSVGPFGASYPIKKTYTVNATRELKLIVSQQKQVGYIDL